jgi:hypothetical protein
VPLSLRRGRVTAIRERHDAFVRLEVDGIACVAYPTVTGPVALEDEVLVNVQARALELGSGGFDVLYANLTRGLELAAEEGAHVMVLPYTPLQHARVHAEEAGGECGRLGGDAGRLLLAPQPGRAGVRGAGGAARRLPAAHRRRTAGVAVGHGADAAGARLAGLDRGGGAVLRRGRAMRLTGLGTALGPRGARRGRVLGRPGDRRDRDALRSRRPCGCRRGERGTFARRLAGRRAAGFRADERDRHRGRSHHTEAVLALVRGEVVVAEPSDGWRQACAGLPLSHMGRGPDEDPDFFAAAYGAGVAARALLG